MQDVSNQKKVDKEHVLASIQALKAKGWDVNPYTVADEARIPRSALYRDPELMQLVTSQRGTNDPVATIETLQAKVSELEEQLREVEETIWGLEKRNEELEKERQDAWHGGYQAGHAEAARKYGRGAQPNGEQQDNGGGQSESMAPLADNERGYTPVSHDSVTLFAGVDHASAPGPGAAEASTPQSPTDTGELAALDVPSERLHQKHEQPAIQPPSPGQVRAQDGIYNQAQSGPMVGSHFNPLVELSWRDVETVYNFAVSSLQDINTGTFPDPTRYPRHDQAPIPPKPSQPAPKSGKAARPAEPPTIDLEGLENIEGVVSSKGNNVRIEARQGEAFGAVFDPSRTGDKLQAYHDPRHITDSEAVVDLDALDIFEDLDDYIDLDKIDVIQDVNLPPDLNEFSDESDKMAGDELRELIKGRIKQASEMPSEAQAAHAMGAPGVEGVGKGGAGMGSRNKFIGSKAQEGGAAPVPPPAPIMVRQVPPEIRKAMMILGVRAEEMTQQIVIDAWKRQISMPGVHPDLGGDTEAAVYLNTAKDTLVRWLDQQAPKLGKKFGSSAHKDARVPEPPSKNPPDAGQK